MMHPFLSARQNSVKWVMYDVVLALLPIAVTAAIAYGWPAVWIMLTAIGSAVVADGLFSGILLKKPRAFTDGSAIITGLLLSFTLSPLTPLPVVAFGSAAAILFGKILWGGLGKNRFNPALTGREFMSAFFPVMTSAAIWSTGSLVKQASWRSDDTILEHLLSLLYKPSGALGEYSVVLISLGGLYLLLRNRISWHIPFGMLSVFTLCLWLLPEEANLRFSTGGLLLGGLFMATDMPSSPDHKPGKIYYGAMIGMVCFLLLLGGVRFEYQSFAILILNGMSPKINQVFQPTVWGKTTNWKTKTEKIFLLTAGIVGISLSVISLNYYGLEKYALFAYIIYIIFKFDFSLSKTTATPL